MTLKEDNLKIRLFYDLSFSHKHITNPKTKVTQAYLTDIIEIQKKIFYQIFPKFKNQLDTNNIEHAFFFASQKHVNNYFKNKCIDKTSDLFMNNTKGMENLLTYIKQNDPVIAQYFKLK